MSNKALSCIVPVAQLMVAVLLVMQIPWYSYAASSVRGLRHSENKQEDEWLDRDLGASLESPPRRQLNMASASKTTRGGAAGYEYYEKQTSATAPNPAPPLASIDNIQYQGAFRLKNGVFGVSDLNYAIGTLAYNPDRHSLFIVGHAQDNAVAEFSIIHSGTQSVVADLPETGAPLQEFVNVLGNLANPDELDRVTGMMVVDGALYVNAEKWYDAGADNKDTSLYVTNANNIAGSQANGFYKVTGGANGAGYMGAIPAEFQSVFGGAEYYTGWSSVYSITSRYSLGPSFWTFRPQDMQQGGAVQVTAEAWMNYGYSNGDSTKWLSPRATEWAAQGTQGPFPPADDLWNPLSKGMYGFFIPNSRTWCVIGCTGGLTSGMGYKAIQSNGAECAGPCPYDPNDWYNYYWLYDVEDIANADNPSEPRPYARGAWELPYVTDPASHRIIGATVGDGVLYVAVANAAKVGDYDQPPLILTFNLSTDMPQATPQPTSAPVPTDSPATKIPTMAPVPPPAVMPALVPTPVPVLPPTPMPAPDPTPVPTPVPDLIPPTSVAPVPAVQLDLAAIDDLQYQGAFRLKNGEFGISDINYAIGTLAYNPERHSLFIVGHAHESAVAEYAIVNTGTQSIMANLPETDAPLQEFVSVLGEVNNPENLDRITGMMVVDGVLYVNAETWYDAPGDNKDTSLYVTNANNLAESATAGFYEVTGGANSAGYMGAIPSKLQALFGGAKYYTGWSSVYSITSRYSQGPSFWTFQPQDMQQGGAVEVAATAWMNYGYSNGDSTKWLSPRATEWAAQGTQGPFPPADDLWNPLSRGMYGFFIPNSRTWCVIGSTGGLTSGMGYKAIQSNGAVCGGPCPYDPNDWYNYYWLYDVEDIANADSPSQPRPYAHGVWELPYVTDPDSHRIIGGTVGDGVLYIALANAARVGDYDQPPLILTFNLSTDMPQVTPQPTPAPVPTGTPVPSPTAMPVPSPTAIPVPVPVPSRAPILIASPVPPPTSMPVPDITLAPIPTPSPIFPPTPMPISAPTPPPSYAPVPTVQLNRAAIGDLQYQGAFRLKNGEFGVSDINYAIGTLAYNPDRHSLFIVGHAHQTAVAEYAIVNTGTQSVVADLPETGTPLQNFVSLLGAVSNPEGLDRITGMMVMDGVLYVNAEKWYDAGADNKDTSLYVANANNLAGSQTNGFYEVTGGANSAGYMGSIPAEFQSLFGGAEYYTGWSSVYSITSRYSQGPSFWTFRPQDMQQDGAVEVAATSWINYGYSNGDSTRWLSLRATEWAAQGTQGPFPPADDLWNPLSRGMYGFFVPNSRTWCVIGSTGGLTSGIGYKAVQINSAVCGGPCPYDPNDWYNYYWLYDVEDIANADSPSQPRPYAHGVWELPYVTDPDSHRIIGGTVGDGVLYIALANAARVGDYDQPPLILKFQLPT